MQERQVPSLGGKSPLEKEKATHSSIFAWEIPWIEKPGGLQSVRHNSETKKQTLRCEDLIDLPNIT